MQIVASVPVLKMCEMALPPSLFRVLVSLFYFKKLENISVGFHTSKSNLSLLAQFSSTVLRSSSIKIQVYFSDLTPQVGKDYSGKA